MSVSIRPRTFVASVALATMLAACGESKYGDQADSAEPAVIDERQANFEEIGDAFKAIRGQRENDAPDFALIASNAQTINTNAGRIVGHFPEGTGMDDGHDTEALATIWKSPDEFAAAADNLAVKSAALAEAASAKNRASVAAAVRELGGACKQCHDTYRLDKE